MILKIRFMAWRMVFLAVLASAMAANPARAAAPNSQTSSEEKQRALIKVLQSDAPPQEKAVTCKQLAIYGTKDAVPVLAPLLADPSLASWARIALEVIPGSAADDALREAMGKLQGRLLIGTINSIAYRRDTKAVEGLVGKLKDNDAGVAAAAAVALGRIGGNQAAQALEQSLSGAPSAVQPAVAEGCILCAERFMAEAKFSQAIKLYDLVRKAEVPKQKRLEALRGAILARQSAGLPLLLEQLNSTDKATLGMGLRTARELPGRKVTEALAAELERTSPDRQTPLLLALADRGDEAVLPAIIKVVKSGPQKLQVAAMGVLQRLGNVSCVPVLLDAAAGGDVELAKAAKAALTLLPGKEVNADLASRLTTAAGKKRQVLIELAGQRRINTALPTIALCISDADAGIRSSAVEAIGAIGEAKQAADLVKLLQKTQDAKERGEIEKALLTLSGRCGSGCAQYLLPLAKNGDSSLRTIGLHALASVGGPEALATVKAACNDPDEAVQDEAVRTLSTWPDNWPEDAGAAEALLTLAKSGKKMSHQVLGLRGYLQYLQGDKQLKSAEKLAKVKELLPLIKRPEEQRLAIVVLGSLPTAGVLEQLTAFADDPAIAEDAYSAIAKLAGGNMEGVSKEHRQQALQLVVEKTKNDATKKRAGDLLRRIR
jgi:HEAT repeat protein